MKIKNFLEQSPIYAVYKANLKIIEHFQNDLKHLQVNFFQALVLIAVFFEDKKVQPVELVKIFNVKPSNVSHSLKNLEEKGFIKRSRTKEDARAHFIELTSYGKKTSLTLIKKFDLLQNGLEDELGTNNFAYFVQEINLLIDAYKSRVKWP